MALMRLSVYLALLFVVISPASAGKDYTGGDLIETTCGETNYAELCINTLLADPRSLKVPYKDLGPIMAEQVLANATAVQNFIKKQLAEEKSPEAKKALSKCHKGYTTAVGELNGVMGEFKKVNFEPIVGAMRSVQKAAVECEGEFKKLRGVKSPLRKKNKLMGKLADNGFVVMSDMMV